MRLWILRWLGLEGMGLRVAQMEEELTVYRRYLHEAVVAEPGRETLKSWRAVATPETTHAHQ